MSDAIQQIIDRLTIDDVAHARSNYWITDDYLARPPEELNIRLQLRSHVDHCDVDEIQGPDSVAICRYRFFYDLGLRILDNDVNDDEDSDKGMIAVIESRMYAMYVEQHDSDREKLDPVILEEFGKSNALYHVWPYWREYVQAVLTRLRLPAITIPMFRLPEENWRQKPAEPATD